jgi:hypothetical protein
MKLHKEAHYSCALPIEKCKELQTPHMQALCVGGTVNN